MNAGRIAGLLFWLLFFGLVLRHWQGANTLLGTGSTGANTIFQTLSN